MKNVFGHNLTVTLFGESHGVAIGAVLDGMPSGVKVDIDYINQKLELRKPYGKISTSRVEKDEIEILSGVFNGYTTGTAIALIIKNVCQNSKDYTDLKIKPRPSHADYTAEIKYGGFQDYRGGGHFSGRVTTALVAVGAIVEKALKDKGIYIGTHIKAIQDISDREFIDIKKDITSLSNAQFAVLDLDKKDKMQALIEKVAMDGDSVGGVLETAILGLPVGVGEPWFDGIESVLSHAIFSIPAVKGVEFGLGFNYKNEYGSTCNDQFIYEDGKVITKTNNNGGINGGISNGMPVIMRTAIKPTPSIYKEQNTVNLQTGENVSLQIKGRHDPAIIHRARVVVDMMTALALGDLLITNYGTNFLK